MLKRGGKKKRKNERGERKEWLRQRKYKREWLGGCWQSGILNEKEK